VRLVVPPKLKGRMNSMMRSKFKKRSWGVISRLAVIGLLSAVVGYASAAARKNPVPAD